MGKHSWIRHDDEAEDKQPGCIWGLVHALHSHHRHSNLRKMIHNRKFEGQSHSAASRSPKRKLLESDELEKLVNDQDSAFVSTKTSSPTNKRSLKARMKALIAEENSKEEKKGKHKADFSVPPRLQRTYSIHHLEPADGSLHKIITDWKHPIIFFPSNVDNGTTHSVEAEKKVDYDEKHISSELEEVDDFLDMFKVDKELFGENVKSLDKTAGDFSDNLLSLNKTAKFSKSRSFPVSDLSQRRELKPSKLEHKKTETWLFREGDKLQAEQRLASSEKDRSSHQRGYSLNESVDKYALLFPNSYGSEVKLHQSKSLKSINEHGLARVSFKKFRSLSQVDYYYSDHKFGVPGNDISTESSNLDVEKNSSDVIGENGRHDYRPVMEDDFNIKLNASNDDNEAVDVFVVEADEVTAEESDFNQKQATNYTEIIPEKNSEIESHKLPSSFNSALNTEKIENAETHTFEQEEYQKETDPDLYYVRNILEKSGIMENAFEIIWHSSDQLLSPKLFEEVETCWDHEQDQLTGWPDFYGCWHHRLLFDVVNEVQIQIYDKSFPYYPKPLSSSCRVRPKPVGNHLIEEVSRSIDALLNFKPKETESLDTIVAYDLANDYSWMNLQLESETVALDLEDMIFDELLEEIICA